MKTLWNYISLLGTADAQSEAQKNRIVLINHINVISLFLMLCGAANLLLLNDYQPALILTLAASFILIAIAFNISGRANVSASCLMIIVNLVIFYFSNYFNQANGVYFFYFPVAMSIAFLFDYRVQRLYFFIHFSMVCCLISILLLAGDTDLFRRHIFTDAYIKQVFGFNLFASVFLLLYFVYLITKTADLRQHKLLQTLEEKALSEDRSRIALQEKETLLAEVHHRVKNNLAVISGLLNLQMHSANNDYTRSILLDCKSRVSSMSLVHEKLYKSPSLSQIDFHSYLADLVTDIQHSFSDRTGHVAVRLAVPPIFLTVSDAIPCGLILNELLTNAYKHAFSGIDNPEISVSIEQLNPALAICVTDNGKGMPPTINAKEAGTLGLILINSLAGQLDANYDFKNAGGTTFSLIFTPKSLKESTNL